MTLPIYHWRVRTRNRALVLYVLAKDHHGRANGNRRKSGFCDSGRCMLDRDVMGLVAKGDNGRGDGAGQSCAESTVKAIRERIVWEYDFFGEFFEVFCLQSVLSAT